jgi:hypothetical protein
MTNLERFLDLDLDFLLLDLDLLLDFFLECLDLDLDRLQYNDEEHKHYLYIGKQFLKA